ncbi:class I SAM-dependent methyltransferase [Mycolicibacterium sp. F2034L]|uniref:class I SAM-dependent methyltransferase n=1 Tax=Mycolicibacterium sp. F2034L TaxID=2926422 RepID=UPI001FF69882|nr:class I SAM-dependent methyltransferase [Mycolicibacterium sp. F2034L]MCK0174631.1 methyltransferase domain-containing protein [Mycolicibacterium sp. F2034L]
MTSTSWSAGRYEAVAERIATIAAEVVDVAARRRPLKDAALIDLACGTGNAALIAAARGAHVTGVDITPELMAIGAARDGGTGVTWVAADASATGLPEQSFDVVVSNMGIIFVEPTAQIAEVTRLLRPGGTLAFSTWVRGETNPFFDPIVSVLGAPPDAGYTPDQWGRPDLAAARLDADFDDVAFESGVHAWHFDSHEAAMRFIIDESPMHVAALARVPTARQALLAAFAEAMAGHADQRGGVSFDAPYAVISAVRSGDPDGHRA